MTTTDPIDCLRQMADTVRSAPPEPEPFQYPERTYYESWDGGDCTAHGRYYGRGCVCCDRDARRHYNDARSDFELERWRKLEDLAFEATQHAQAALAS